MARNTVDREALAQLHEQAYRWSLFCCRFDEEATRDNLQSVYVAILEGRARYGGKATLKTWLFAVIKRAAAHERQTRNRRESLLAALPETEETGADSTEQQAALARTRRLVSDCLARLPDRQRAVVELVYYHDLPVRECAAVLGISSGAAAERRRPGALVAPGRARASRQRRADVAALMASQLIYTRSDSLLPAQPLLYASQPAYYLSYDPITLEIIP